MNVQPPVNWLWEQLATLLPTQDYIDLQIDYQEQQRRYRHQSRLNTARRELKTYERMLNEVTESRRSSYEDKIARRKATIERLESEIEAST